MVPGVGGLSVNIPQFELIKIKLPENKILEIRKNKSKNYFINSLKFNEIEQNSTWMWWDKIKEGGTIKFNVSANSSYDLYKIKPPSYN